jgi:hypothetical protein
MTGGRVSALVCAAILLALLKANRRSKNPNMFFMQKGLLFQKDCKETQLCPYSCRNGLKMSGCAMEGVLRMGRGCMGSL